MLWRVALLGLADLGLGGGEAGVRINHLAFCCKHSVNNLSSNLVFLCLSEHKVRNNPHTIQAIPMDVSTISVGYFSIPKYNTIQFLLSTRHYCIPQ